MKDKFVYLVALVLVVSVSQVATASEKGGMNGSQASDHEHSDLKSGKSQSAGAYAIDATHSTLGFAVKHMGVGTTRGKFNDYEGTIHFDPNDYSTFKADVTIQAASIDTENETRDNHLRSPDFFDVEQYPTISFKSDRLEKRGEGAVVVGDLTMHGVTKQLTIPVTTAGPVKGMGGKEVIGLAAQRRINRQDFGISWNKTLDNGGLVVADEVDLIIEIEAAKK